MPTRDSLERLAAAGRPLQAHADSLVDDSEQDRIFERILASDRRTLSAHRGRRSALLLAGVALLAAATAVASVELTRSPSRPAASTVASHHAGVKTITLAGYRFRLPAGYDSSGPCKPATSTPGDPNTVIDSMSAAASDDGGCIGVAILGRSWTAPPDAQPVSVGSYDGFLVPGSQEALFVQIPVAQGDHYLVISGEGLTAAQLVAIAESGLPSATGTTTTCTENCG